MWNSLIIPFKNIRKTTFFNLYLTLNCNADINEHLDNFTYSVSYVRIIKKIENRFCFLTMKI